MTTFSTRAALMDARLQGAARGLGLQRSYFDLREYVRARRETIDLSVNDRTGVLFVHVPKCAGTTSIRQIPLAHGHRSAEFFLWRDPALFERCFTFGFVRNPYDRLGIVAEPVLEAWLPLSPGASGHGNDLGRAERREAVHQGDADVDLCGLPVGVSCAYAFSEGLEAAHLRFDPASGMVPGPPLPERPAIVPCGTQGLVSGPCRRAVPLPRSSVPSDRDDCGGLPFDDGGVAAAGVIGPVGGHGADLLVLRDLVEQIGQDRAVALAAGGEFHGADVRCGRVHRQMHLAPLAAPLDAVLAGLPLAVAKELDPCAVHQQVERAVGAAVGDLHSQCLLSAAER